MEAYFDEDDDYVIIDEWLPSSQGSSTESVTVKQDPISVSQQPDTYVNKGSDQNICDKHNHTKSVNKDKPGNRYSNQASSCSSDKETNSQNPSSIGRNSVILNMDSKKFQNEPETDSVDRQTCERFEVSRTQDSAEFQSTQGFEVEQSTQGFELSNSCGNLIMDLNEDTTQSLPVLSNEALTISEPIKLISLLKGIYTCTACNFTDTSKDGFQKHLEKHTLSNAFMCMHCANVSMNVSDIRNHIEMKHRGRSVRYGNMGKVTSMELLSNLLNQAEAHEKKSETSDDSKSDKSASVRNRRSSSASSTGSISKPGRLSRTASNDSNRSVLSTRADDTAKAKSEIIEKDGSEQPKTCNQKDAKTKEQTAQQGHTSEGCEEMKDSKPLQEAIEIDDDDSGDDVTITSSVPPKVQPRKTRLECSFSNGFYCCVTCDYNTDKDFKTTDEDYFALHVAKHLHEESSGKKLCLMKACLDVNVRKNCPLVNNMMRLLTAQKKKWLEGQEAKQKIAQSKVDFEAKQSMGALNAKLTDQSQMQLSSATSKENLLQLSSTDHGQARLSSATSTPNQLQSFSTHHGQAQSSSAISTPNQLQSSSTDQDQAQTSPVATSAPNQPQSFSTDQGQARHSPATSIPNQPQSFSTDHCQARHSPATSVPNQLQSILIGQNQRQSSPARHNQAQSSTTFRPIQPKRTPNSLTSSVNIMSTSGTTVTPVTAGRSTVMGNLLLPVSMLQQTTQSVGTTKWQMNNQTVTSNTGTSVLRTSVQPNSISMAVPVSQPIPSLQPLMMVPNSAPRSPILGTTVVQPPPITVLNAGIGVSMLPARTGLINVAPAAESGVANVMPTLAPTLANMVPAFSHNVGQQVTIMKQQQDGSLVPLTGTVVGKVAPSTPQVLQPRPAAPSTHVTLPGNLLPIAPVGTMSQITSVVQSAVPVIPLQKSVINPKPIVISPDAPKETTATITTCISTQSVQKPVVTTSSLSEAVRTQIPAATEMQTVAETGAQSYEPGHSQTVLTDTPIVSCVEAMTVTKSTCSKPIIISDTSTPVQTDTIEATHDSSSTPSTSSASTPVHVPTPCSAALSRDLDSPVSTGSATPSPAAKQITNKKKASTKVRTVFQEGFYMCLNCNFKTTEPRPFRKHLWKDIHPKNKCNHCPDTVKNKFENCSYLNGLMSILEQGRQKHTQEQCNTSKAGNNQQKSDQSEGRDSGSTMNKEQNSNGVEAHNREDCTPSEGTSKDGFQTLLDMVSDLNSQSQDSRGSQAQTNKGTQKENVSAAQINTGNKDIIKTQCETETSVTGNKITSSPVPMVMDNNAPLDHGDDNNKQPDHRDNNEPLDHGDDNNEPRDHGDDSNEPSDHGDDNSEPLDDEDNNQPLDSGDDNNEPLDHGHDDDDTSEPLDHGDNNEQLDHEDDNNERLAHGDNSESLEHGNNSESLDHEDDNNEPLDHGDNNSESLDHGKNNEPLDHGDDGNSEIDVETVEETAHPDDMEEHKSTDGTEETSTEAQTGKQKAPV